MARKSKGDRRRRGSWVGRGWAFVKWFTLDQLEALLVRTVTASMWSLSRTSVIPRNPLECREANVVCRRLLAVSHDEQKGQTLWRTLNLDSGKLPTK